jgi:hypothetical protein
MITIPHWVKREGAIAMVAKTLWEIKGYRANEDGGAEDWQQAKMIVDRLWDIEWSPCYIPFGDGACDEHQDNCTRCGRSLMEKDQKPCRNGREEHDFYRRYSLYFNGDEL